MMTAVCPVRMMKVRCILIINENRFNQEPKVYSCDICKTVNSLTGSYIALVDEETFLANPQKYIDNAYEKSENDASGYSLRKQR